MKLSEILAQREKKSETPKTTAAKPAKPSNKVIKVIRTRETPNPNALQFVLNAQILDVGNKSYSTLSESESDPMGKAIFELEDIQNVYVMQNFVTVTKSGASYWGPLKDKVWKTIDQWVEVYPEEVVAEKLDVDVENFMKFSVEDKLKAVEMVLNRSIRSNLAKDGGGVELKGIDGNTVKILYQGACGSCPTSTTGTLKYIQDQLRQQIHMSLEVKSV
ncbi:MAG: NifU family protein [Candidatus Nitrohelix vancouverensis]|uniref:NifU family protein n=1 Tax=Candidatus Nitrohelix vancouverensis TaxID=2705534 RepID=A0A7T0G4N4_9BACT|nr:MAG: NifU family protein [Candidatus Nitrohelix vancouverensis]